MVIKNVKFFYTFFKNNLCVSPRTFMTSPQTLLGVCVSENISLHTKQHFMTSKGTSVCTCSWMKLNFNSSPLHVFYMNVLALAPSFTQVLSQ